MGQIEDYLVIWPSTDPSVDPPADPSVDPSADPPADPSVDPPADPSVDPAADLVPGTSPWVKLTGFLENFTSSGVYAVSRRLLC